MLHVLDLPMPKHIFGHPWMLFGNDKMSKSKGNIVYADDLVNKYGVDAIRFYMIHEMPFASDGMYTEALLIDTINANLANVLGNLVNRTIGMVNKYFAGIVTNTKVKENIDNVFIDEILSLKDKIADNINKFRIADSLENIIEGYRKCNKYIDDTTPWILAKDDSKKDRLNTVIYNLVEAIRIITVYLQAYLPDTADSIFKQLNTDVKNYDSVLEFGKYPSGTRVNEPEVLFKRIEKENQV
jgi:methionyl-tRNA synthetase